MNPSTPSDAAIGTLLAGGSLVSGKIRVGPLGPNAARLMRVLWHERDEIARRKGADQAVTLREAFLRAGDEGGLATSPRTEAAPAGAEGDGIEVIAQAR